MVSMRKEVPTDQEYIKAFLRAVDEASAAFPEIYPNLKVSACAAIIVTSFKESGCSYEEFVQDMLKMMSFYKKSWED